VAERGVAYEEGFEFLGWGGEGGVRKRFGRGWFRFVLVRLAVFWWIWEADSRATKRTVAVPIVNLGLTSCNQVVTMKPRILRLRDIPITSTRRLVSEPKPRMVC
jgi:hypothetical protein